MRQLFNDYLHFEHRDTQIPSFFNFPRILSSVARKNIYFVFPITIPEAMIALALEKALWMFFSSAGDP